MVCASINITELGYVNVTHARHSLVMALSLIHFTTSTNTYVGVTERTELISGYFGLASNGVTIITSFIKIGCHYPVTTRVQIKFTGDKQWRP
jgi:hypothetical protein